MLEQDILDALKALGEKIDRLSSELALMRSEERHKRPTKASKAKPAPMTQEEMSEHQEKFTQAYERWLSGDELGVQEMLDKLDVENLRRFADANNLNVTSKMSKDRVLQLIGGRFREKRQLLQALPTNRDVS